MRRSAEQIGHPAAVSRVAAVPGAGGSGAPSAKKGAPEARKGAQKRAEARQKRTKGRAKARKGAPAPAAARPPRKPAATVALAFYNGREHGRWLDRLIARHDRDEPGDAPIGGGRFSHVELVLEHAPRRASLCFSSSWRDGGVRYRRIRLEETPGKWTLVWLTIPPRQAKRLRAWCGARLGGRYDVPGVLAFKLPWVRQRLNWWFCSEICTAALQEAGLLAGVEPHRVSPNGLYRLALAGAREVRHA